jgi:predicted NAD/FAD-binding protein
MYEHPHYNLNSIRGQELIRKLQGRRRTYYAGAHLGYGFHEDGVSSAVGALNAMQVKTLWD